MSSKQQGYPSLVGGSNRVWSPGPLAMATQRLSGHGPHPLPSLLAAQLLLLFVVERTAVLMSVLELGPPSPPPPREAHQHFVHVVSSSMARRRVVFHTGLVHCDLQRLGKATRIAGQPLSWGRVTFGFGSALVPSPPCFWRWCRYLDPVAKARPVHSKRSNRPAVVMMMMMIQEKNNNKKGRNKHHTTDRLVFPLKRSKRLIWFCL